MSLITETNTTAMAQPAFVPTDVTVDFINLLFEPGDLLCFGFLDAAKNWKQVFRVYEIAITREFIAKLHESNASGNNVYVAMNTYRSSQRTEKNVAAVRNLWAEIDENGRENLNKVFASTVVPDPAIVMETSPNKFHVIWKIENAPVEEAKALLKSICVEFNGDSNAIDAARVLRLPGFKNCKYVDLPEVEVVHLSDSTSRRALSEFHLAPAKAADAPAQAQAPAPAVAPSAPLVPKSEEEIAKRVAAIFASGQNVLEGGRNSNLTSVAGKLHNLGLSLQDLEYQLSLYNNEFHVPPLDSAEVRTIARSIDKKAIVDPDAVTVLINGVPPNKAVVSTAVAPEVFNWSTPIPLNDALSPVAAFKPEFLPDSIRPWVVDVSERMSVPLDFAGVCALVTIAGVIGRRVFVCPKAKDKEWKESIALSGAVVADSGKKKTPTWKTFTNIVVEKEADWQEDYKKKAAKYAEDSKAWEILDKKNSEVERKTGVVQNTPPPPDEPTPSRRLILNDATPEKMHDVMKSNPCGVFYLRDELSSWVAEFDKEGREAQRGLFLAAMNGNDPYNVDRMGREGGYATMCASVFGGFQPDLFREFLSNATDVSSGMIPRFSFLVWPDESDLPLVDRTANDSAKQQFRHIIRELAEMGEKQILMHFSPEAQFVFDKWLADITKKTDAETNRGKKSHLSKYNGALPKIAALLQIVDLVSNGPLAGTHLIDLAHTNKAIDLLCYLETHMHRVYDCIQTPIQMAESVIAKQLKNGELRSGFTIRTLQRQRRCALSTAENIGLALETLEENGWIRKIITPSGPLGGRPTARWEINPTLLNRD